MDESLSRIVESGPGQITVVDFEPENRVIIVNPNPYLLYKDTIAGRGLEFVPFRKYEVKESIADMLCTRAAQNWSQQKLNAQYCRQHWAECFTATSQRKKDMAQKFCDMRYGLDAGVPVVKVWPRPGIVRIDTPAGQEYYNQGLAWIEQANDDQLDAYKKEYESFIWEPEEKKATATVVRKSQAALEEAEEQTAPLNVIELEKPKETWEEEQKVGYIERYTHAECNPPEKNRAKWLNDEMQKAYEKAKEIYENAHVVYKEV